MVYLFNEARYYSSNWAFFSCNTKQINWYHMFQIQKLPYPQFQLLQCLVNRITLVGDFCKSKLSDAAQPDKPLQLKPLSHCLLIWINKVPNSSQIWKHCVHMENLCASKQPLDPLLYHTHNNTPHHTHTLTHQTSTYILYIHTTNMT